MGGAQSTGEGGIVTVVAPGRHTETALTSDDEACLKEVEFQLASLGDQLRNCIEPGRKAAAAPVGSATTSSATATASASATGVGGSGGRLQRLGSVVEERSRLAVGPGLRGPSGSKAGAVASAGATVSVLSSIDWLGLQSYISYTSSGQAPQAHADAVELSHALLAEIRAYREWLRRREEDATRQQAALHREIAAAEAAARAAAGRLSSATTSNARLGAVLEAQLAAISGGLDALASRAEAAAAELAACRDALRGTPGEGLAGDPGADERGAQAP